MGYFDDLTVLSVRKVTTSVAKTPAASTVVGALGVIEGHSVIRLIGSRKKQFRLPIVYWSVPGTLLAWSSPAGQIRTNFWVDLCGERAQRFLPELHKLSPDDLLQIDNPVPFTYLLERLNQEIKRRTHIIRTFPNSESCLRLVRALAVETHEAWQVETRYLNMDELRECKKEVLFMKRSA